MTPYGKGTAIISKHGKYPHLRKPDKTVNAENSLIAQAVQYKPAIPWTGAIGAKITAVFGRPKDHFRTGKFKDVLRGDAPVYHIVKIDIDNMCKLVFDSLKQVFFKDDCQICKLEVDKIYGDIPMLRISLLRLDD